MVTFPPETATDSITSGEATVILNDRAALRLGTPLSVTKTVTMLVEGGWLVGGVQVNTPLAASMVAPAGAPGAKLKVRMLAGESGSVAELVTVNRVPAKAI